MVSSDLVKESLFQKWLSKLGISYSKYRKSRVVSVCTSKLRY